MRVVLRICSEQKGELYSISTNGRLSILKEVNPDNLDLRLNSIKAVVLSNTFYFWKSVNFEKKLIEDKKKFIFLEDAISELNQIYFTPVIASKELNLISQAWVRKDTISVLFETWNINGNIPIYPESFLENKSAKEISVNFGGSLIVFQRSKHHPNISENSTKTASQSDLSNLTIVSEKKFRLPHKVGSNFTKPLVILASVLLLALNVYSYISITDTNEYAVKSSRVQDVLNDLSKVYSEFSPGSVHEIRIQDGGKNARISLLDDKFDVSRIKEVLKAKYFVEFENINKPHVLILNEKGEGSD
jgi:hypothetical protein